MKKTVILALGASVFALAAAPASAQTVPVPDEGEQTGDIETGAGADQAGDGRERNHRSAQQDDGDIIVTAQRRAESLQNVPIAVSAFTGEALERQQIENASDLQQSLPNVTYTKTNFTSSSFTIRGIGDLCTGFSCDSATGIHVNDMPLTSTRLFETEYFDLERVEVLRGPQGTLFGRNATSGVVNFITARPNLNEFQASVSAEYGNFDSMKLTGMVNVPIGDVVGIRLAGYWLNRDGYMKNTFDNSRIDDRDLYALRGTIRIQPTSSTTLDLIGYHFHERDNRSRIQKQLCHRDNTGILGCQPDRLAFETVNGNATLAAILTSREFFRINNAALTNFGLGSLYGADNFFGGVDQSGRPAHRPDRFQPDLFRRGNASDGAPRAGDRRAISTSPSPAAGPSRRSTAAPTTISSPAIRWPAMPASPTFVATAAAPGGLFPGGVNPYTQARAALIGPGGTVCTSETNLNYTGIFGGFVNRCTAGSTDYDRSQSHSRQYSIEAHLDSDFEGPFNFLVGGIYLDNRFTDSNYYVASFGLDYAAGILGAATALGQRAAGNVAFPNVFLAPPTYNSEVNLFSLKSYGLFGEVYFDVSDKLRLTGGLRYSNDKKRQVARVPLLSWPVPFGTTDANASPFVGQFRRRPDHRRQPALQHRPRRLRRVHRPLRRRLQSDPRQPHLRLLVARL